MVRILTQSLKIITIVVIGIFSVAGSIWFFDYWQDREASPDEGAPVVIVIEEEDDSSSVGDMLSDEDLVNFPFYFETRMRFADVELRPGVYTLRKGMSVPEIIDAITSESIATGEEGTAEIVDSQVIEVTLIEGQRAEEFGAAIEEAGYPDGQQVFMDALDSPNVRDRWSFLDDVPGDASINGFLFPDTYTFTTDYTGEDMVNVMLENFGSRVTDETREQFEAQGLSIYEAVTLASIVERESAVAEERQIIAAVYLNRLNSEDGMVLNADPTIQYAVGEPGNWWPAPLTDAQLAIESPYNSYTNQGLPPSPISNPGLGSLQAVGQPADVDYLYFFARQDGSGEHVFATTYEEHQQNVCQISPEACEGAIVPGDSDVAMRTVDPRWLLA